MSEVRTKVDQMTERLQILGATADQIESIIGGWEGLEPDEQEHLWRANDAILSEKLWGDRDVQVARQRAMSDTPITDAAVRDHAELVAEQETADWDLLALRIETILETVADNPEHAWRLHRLESMANRPRKTLMAALAEIAWPHGQPDDPDAVPAPNAAQSGGDDDAYAQAAAEAESV